MSELQILHTFKTNMIEFFDELIYQFPKEGDLLYMRIFIKDQVPIRDVMKVFIVSLDENNGAIRKMAKERNEKFFLEHNIFDQLSKTTANHFKKLWTSNEITDDDKTTIWNWIDRFVALADYFKRLQ